jgi:hypothetical protein
MIQWSELSHTGRNWFTQAEFMCHIHHELSSLKQNHENSY